MNKVRHRRTPVILSMLGLLFLVASSGRAREPASEGLPIQEHIFENGLRLLVLERPSDHRVACKIFTDFGGLVETPGQAGAAHFLEHLMFKGTHTLGTRDWERERPLQEELAETEQQLIKARNRARNALRERGVFHTYRHADSTPEIDRLNARIADLDSQLTAFRDGGAMMRWYQGYGGTRLTATTEQEYMKFDINLPVERVELFLRVEADRMVNSVFREFDQERMILVEQRLGDLNRPTTPYYEEVAAASGIAHPVFWPEGHYPNDFYQYTRSGERELYEEYFVVNNTTLVFVGGVTLKDLIPRVQHYFGWMSPADPPARAEAVEPRPNSERRVIFRSSDLAPRVEYRHLIPAIGHPDRPHFDVLAEVASREIQEALKRNGISAQVNVNTRVVHTVRFGVPSTINFEVVLGNSDEEQKAEQTLLGVIEKLKEGTIAPDTLSVARKRLRTDWHRVAADPDALAFEIGHFQTMDRWQTLPQHLSTRERTSIADLQRLAELYFVPENRTVGIARPESRSDDTTGVGSR